MEAYAIVIEGHEVSEQGYTNLEASSKKVKNSFQIKKFNAIVSKMARTVMSGNGIRWKYPWEGQETDIKTGLIKTAYPTANRNTRIACALSHWLLWHKCLSSDEPLLILEHDALFIKKLDHDKIIDSKYDIIGINSPAAATRKAHEFHDKVQATHALIQPVPTIDEFNVPQGLAGNSAYIIKPAGAKAVLDAVKEHGLWPNDAIMCKQIIPNLGVTKTYYTRVQGLPSTTVT
jgi:GR25 family glycosyltransferase involved in LPS biosynthesis|tara:strand:- start:16 stop:711 length:696 start_codon:yes stop_codon:yes gene_type:complete